MYVKKVTFFNKVLTFFVKIFYIPLNLRFNGYKKSHSGIPEWLFKRLGSGSSAYLIIS